MAFGLAALAAAYAGPGSVAVAASTGEATRGFLEIETLTASDGGGLTALRRTTLRIQAESLDVGVDDELVVEGATYRVTSGPDPIDDGAEAVLELTGPLA